MFTNQENIDMTEKRDDLIDTLALFTPQERAEIDEAMKDWVPHWGKPMSPNEWDKLVKQRANLARMAMESHTMAVNCDTPLFLLSMIAKTRYRLCRAYWRTKRRAEFEKLDATNKLFNLIVQGT